MRKIEIEKLEIEAANALNKVPKGDSLGTFLFEAISRLTISVAIETVALKRENEEIKVLLRKRLLPEERAYHGMWHCPGTILRSGEEIKDAFSRLQKKEYKTIFEGEPIFVDFLNHPDEKRGHFLQLIFLVKADKTIEGEWFPINKLPKGIIEQHRQLINISVKKFK